MAQIARNAETGEEFIYNEETGTWVPMAGVGENLLVQAGGELTRLGRGGLNLLGIGDVEARRERQRVDDAFNEGLRDARPVSSFVGQALPYLASAPVGAVGQTAAQSARIASLIARSPTAQRFAPQAIINWATRSGPAYLAGSSTARNVAASQLRRGLALSGGLGVIEGGLAGAADDTGAGMGAFTGGLGGVLGEAGGRMAGRVVNAIRGTGRELIQDADVGFFRDRGAQVLPSEALNVPGQPIEDIVRLEQGARSGLFPPPVFREVIEERAQIANSDALASIGLDPRQFDNLGPDALGTAGDRLADQFQAFAGNVIDEARVSGDLLEGDALPISEALANRLRTRRGQVKELIEAGDFEGLQKGVEQPSLQPDELLLAWRSRFQDAQERAAKGQHEIAQKFFDEAEELSDVLQGLVGEDQWADYMRIREQYRNLQILQSSNVINTEGDINPVTLRNRLAADRGYGRVFREGREAALQPETQQLIETARVLSRRNFQPRPTSNTPEGTALRDTVNAAAQVASTGDPVGAAVFGSQFLPGLVLRATGGNNRAAAIFGGLLQPGGPLAGRVGAELATAEAVRGGE